MSDHFHDIKPINRIDTSVNFIIKCSDTDELEHLKNVLGLKKKACTYEEFMQKIKPDEEHHHQQFKIQFD